MQVVLHCIALHCIAYFPRVLSVVLSVLFETSPHEVQPCNTCSTPTRTPTPTPTPAVHVGWLWTCNQKPGSARQGRRGRGTSSKRDGNGYDLTWSGQW